MAYASNTSPFSSVKGQNIFMSGINATTSQSSTTTPTAKRPGFASYASPTSPFTAAVRTKSPLMGTPSILGRAKSPSHRTKSSSTSNPFASYAGPVHSFAIPASKRARAGSPDGSSRSSLERNSAVSALGGSANGSDSGPEDDGDQTSSFGERLRAAKDYDNQMFDGEPKVQLSEQDGNE